MIGKLTGIIDSLGDDYALIDVNGVGYVVFCAAATLAKLGPGMHVALLIDTKMSEEAIRLYGFLTHDEREWFRLLQSVQGVGAKVALAILTVLNPTELQRALALGDKAMVGRAQGVGPKLALRIVTELKGKAPKSFVATGADLATVLATPVDGGARAAESDARAALINLGYGEADAAEAVARAALHLGDGAKVGDIIREALKGMGR